MTMKNDSILSSRDNIDAYFGDIEKIYVSNGWGNAYPEALLERMFRNAYYLVATSEQRAVGFLRGFTDGVMVTHLSEIVVHPLFQRQGIAGILVRRFLEDVSHTTVYAEALNPEAGSLLRQHGFCEKRQLMVFARKKDAENSTDSNQ